MTVNEFARTLAKELAARGVGRDEAIKHSAALVRTFSREDLREVEDYGCADDFKELSDSLAALIFSRAAREKKAAEKSADAAVSAQTAMSETETAAETETDNAAMSDTDNAAGTDISTDTAAETDGG